HVFRMQAFFLVAGFFARMVYLKLGTSSFITHRVKRIAVPLIMFWPLVYFAIVILWTWGIHKQRMMADSSVQPIDIFQTSKNTLISGQWLSAGFPWTHLWFLYTLLWIYTLLLATRALFEKWVDTKGKVRSSVSNFFVNIIQKPGGSLVLALPTIPLMFMMKNKFGVDTPDHGLIPYLPSLAVYFYYFSLGWILHQNAPLIEIFTKYRILNTVIGIILIVIVTTMFLSIVYDPTLGLSLGTSFAWLESAYNTLYAFASMTAMFGFIGMMLFYFSKENSTIRFLADASYWMYLIHLPVVVFFQILVAPLDIHWIFKVLLILIPSFVILLVSYRFLVRFTWVGKLLNGKR
ncbi:MAG: acyltransferase family protein, partial [Chryseolinea sp.]